MTDKSRFVWEPSDIVFLRPVKDEWNEEDHPRDPGGEGGGQFTSGGGGAEFLGKDPEAGKPDAPPAREPFANAKDAEKGFYERHGIRLENNADNPLTGARYTATANALDKTMTDLKEKYPALDNYKRLGGGVHLSNGKELVDSRSGRAMGIYSFDHSSMDLAGGLRHGETKLKYGDFNFSPTAEGVFRHELGHSLEKSLMFHARESGVVPKDFSLGKLYVDEKAADPLGKKLSRYGMSSSKEYFAESFAAYSHPGYATSTKKIHPTMEKIFGLLKGEKK